MSGRVTRVKRVDLYGEVCDWKATMEKDYERERTADYLTSLKRVLEYIYIYIYIYNRVKRKKKIGPLR